MKKDKYIMKFGVRISKIKPILNFIFIFFLLFSIVGYSKKNAKEPQVSDISILLQEIDDVLPNPFKGFATRIGFENPIYETMLQYSRFTWKELEVEKGVIDWDYFEKDWGNIDETGKRVAFRIMCVLPQGTDYYVRLFDYGNKEGTIEERINTFLNNGEGHFDIPEWLIDEGVRMIPYTIEGCKGGMALSPDFNDPKFLKAHRNFIMALGARYDNDPRIAWIDIGTYGFWGEWHWLYRGNHEALEITEETKKAILEHYYGAFPNTPKVITFDDIFGHRYVVKRGGGIRNDCLAGLFNGEDQNEVYLEYVGDLNKTAWKTGIINGEFCGNVKEFIKATTERFNETYDFIQKTHWSVITFKLCQAGGNIEPVSEEHRSNLDKLHKKLGYRFVLLEVSHDEEINKGDTLKITIQVENKGVAPFYFNWPLVLYLINFEGNIALQQDLNVDIRQWLPGTHIVSVDFIIPSNISPNIYEIKLAIHNPVKDAPGVMFANTGQDEEGRYLVSRLKIN
jgi:hypothetical protein